MSTRATYRFYDNYKRLDIYFYVHYDNYPDGAASYFQKMLNYIKESQKSSYAEAFVRTNLHAYFTKNHDVHSDTEYQYNVIKGSIAEDNGYILQAFKFEYRQDQYDKEVRTPEKIFEGSVEDFIERSLLIGL